MIQIEKKSKVFVNIGYFVTISNDFLVLIAQVRITKVLMFWGMLYEI